MLQLIGRNKCSHSIEPDLVRDTYGLPPPHPIEDDNSHAVHMLSAEPTGEDIVTYKFKDSQVVLQHVLPTEYMIHLTNEVFKEFQAEVDFEPVNAGTKFDYSVLGGHVRLPLPRCRKYFAPVIPYRVRKSIPGGPRCSERSVAVVGVPNNDPQRTQGQPAPIHTGAQRAALHGVAFKGDNEGE